MRSVRNCCQDYGAVQIIGLGGGVGLEGVMTGCVPHCVGTIQLRPDVTTDILRVNANRCLPKKSRHFCLRYNRQAFRYAPMHSATTFFVSFFHFDQHLPNIYN